MKIGLNLLYLDQQCGAWTYIERVLRSLSTTVADHQYFAYVHDGCASVVPASAQFTLRRVCSGRPTRVKRAFLEHQVVPRMAVADGARLLHWFGNVASHFSLIRSVVTVYDLKPLEHPPRTLRDVYMRLTMPMTAKRAFHLMPMSEFTAQCLSERFSVDAANMTVLRCPIESGFHRVPEVVQSKFRADYGLPSAFWLYVAHFYRHKNHLRLLDAFSDYCCRFREAAWPLVLRGNDYGECARVKERAQSLGISDRLIWLPFVPEKDMPALYSAATALVFPSEYEGAGLPLLEAMSCGCPVFASAIPAVHEFAGGAAMTFDPTDVLAIANAMCTAHGDGPLLRDLGRRGLNCVSSLRPNVVGGTLMATYERLGADSSEVK